MRRSRRFLASLVLTLPLSWAGAATACPNCKEAVAAQPEDARATASGYNWSVLLMLAMPFTMLGTGAFAVVRASRRGLLPEI